MISGPSLGECFAPFHVACMLQVSLKVYCFLFSMFVVFFWFAIVLYCLLLLFLLLVYILFTLDEFRCCCSFLLFVVHARFVFVVVSVGSVFSMY